VLSAHTPGERCPPSVWTFRCRRGADTGDLGKEEFEVEVAFTRSGDDRVLRDSGLLVKRVYSGPLDFGPVVLSRVFTKTGDPTHVQLSDPVSGWSTGGETNQNTDDGVLHWKHVANGPTNVDVELYRRSTLVASELVCKATNVPPSTVFTATEQNGSGLQVVGKTGSAPTGGATGTMNLNPFRVKNSSGVPDELTVTVTLGPAPGLYQELLGEVFEARLNSDAAGFETIQDDYVRQGTYVPFVEAQ
jgi:hypothetical protein